MQRYSCVRRVTEMNRYLVVTNDDREHFVHARSAQEAADILKGTGKKVAVYLLTGMNGYWS